MDCCWLKKIIKSTRPETISAENVTRDSGLKNYDAKKSLIIDSFPTNIGRNMRIMAMMNP